MHTSVHIKGSASRLVRFTQRGVHDKNDWVGRLNEIYRYEAPTVSGCSQRVQSTGCNHPSMCVRH